MKNHRVDLTHSLVNEKPLLQRFLVSVSAHTVPYQKVTSDLMKEVR